MAEPGFEEVVFDGPFHDVVGNGCRRDAVVVGDCFVVVGFEGGDICDFKV